MGSNEAAEVRKAFDRLQQTVEILSGRYRDARRERRLLQDRLDALERDRIESEAATSARLEAAARDRRRLVELEEQVRALQNRQSEMQDRIADAERTISDRDMLIVEQEETINQLRVEIADVRASGVEQGDAAERAGALEVDLRQAREEATAARAEAAGLQAQIETLEASLASIYESHTGLEEGLRRSREALEEIPVLRARAEELEKELAAARAESGAAAPELEQIRTDLARRTEEHAELEEMVGQLKERLTLAVVERERQSAAINELRSEVERAAVTIESLRRELKQTESTDEERLRAQRVRIEGLTVDLSEALDTAARRERDLEEARRQIEAGREELAALRDEYERVVLMGASASSGAEISDDERREMVDNINNAIVLIDKYLVDT